MPLDIFPYQEEGALFLAQKERAGCFDEMGVGKTAQAIRALDLRRAKRGIIVAPAAVRENWRREFMKFAHMDRRIVKGVSIHDFVAWQKGRYDTLITSYEQITKWAPRIHEFAEIVEFLVIDEAHYLKDGDALRTKALYGPDSTGIDGVAMWAEQTWELSGTRNPNDPFDIFTFLAMVGATPLSREQFRKRYYHVEPRAFGSRQTPRPETLDELRAMIGRYSIRRSKIEANIQLPPIWLTTTVVDGDDVAIRELLSLHPGLERAIVQAVQQGGLSFLDAQHIATLRRLVGEAKAVPYAHMLVDELRSGLDKRVVMGVHRKALYDIRDIVLRAGYHCVMITGDTPERERIAAMDAFQTDPRCKVLIGNIKAAGTGLTMTAANTLDMFESEWSPGPNAQAIMRVHRIGQTRNVTARFIALARSIDATVIDVVAEKTRAVAMVEGSEMIAAPIDQ
jgi:superfamily II DNA or RNA helicase